MLSCLLLLAVLSNLKPLSVSPFNGTWLTDLSASNEDREPEVYRLKDGMFSRGTGPSTVTVKADGHYHKMPGGSYVDEIAVVDLGRNGVRETDRLAGKTVYIVEYQVSASRDALTVKATDFSKPDGRPIPYTFRFQRVGLPDASESALTGRWRQVAVQATRASMIDKVTLLGDRFSLRAPSGYGYEAVIGGPPVRVDGDIGMVAVSMLDERTIVMRSTIDGKPTVTATWRMLPSNAAIQVTARIKGSRTDSKWVMRRQ